MGNLNGIVKIHSGTAQLFGLKRKFAVLAVWGSLQIVPPTNPRCIVKTKR